MDRVEVDVEAEAICVEAEAARTGGVEAEADRVKADGTTGTQATSTQFASSHCRKLLHNFILR